ncbi:MAG TPA: hypothetical protein VGN91_03165 [Bosea sp. (in: a-proteobacteria)]|jgi:hypothetical protein|nr:hypothetical protein [Bosea sp. (in: a-proteobacteria)]
MALQFDTTYYLQQNPDVLAAILAGQIESAEAHFNQFGAFEGRNPNAIFNTFEYLSANPDVLAAGVNGFQHYLAFGAYEGRAPSNSFIQFDDFDFEAYLAANPDLGEAGIDTALEAYGHFVIFGQFEDRPGTPVVVDGFTLTTGTDTATANVFEAPLVTESGQQGVHTLNSADNLTGSGDNPTLNLWLSNSIAGPVSPTLNGISTINYFDVGSGGTILDLSRATGVQNLSVTNQLTGGTPEVRNIKLVEDFKLTLTQLDAPSVFTFTADSIAGDTDVLDVVLNDVTSEASIAPVLVGSIETVNLESTARTGATNQGPNLSGLGVVDLNISGVGSLNFSSVVDVVNADASELQGALTAGFGGRTESVIATAFSDALTFNGTGAELTVDLGEGDNTATLSGVFGSVNITAGAGNDKVTADAANVDGSLVLDLGAGDNELAVIVADEEIDDLDFSGGVTGVQTLTLVDDSGIALGVPATLDLNGIADLATLNVQNSIGEDEEFNSNGQEFTLANGPAALAINAASFVVAGADFNVDGAVDLAINASDGNIEIGNFNSATLATLSLTAFDDVSVVADSDADHDISTLTSLSVVAGAAAVVTIDANDADADVDALSSVSVTGGTTADLTLTGQVGIPAVPGVQEVQTVTFTAPAAADGFVIVTVPGVGPINVPVANGDTADVVAGKVATALDGLTAIDSAVAGGADVVVTFVAEGPQDPLVVNENGTGANSTVAETTPGVEAVPGEDGIGFDGLTSAVVAADDGDATATLTDVYGAFTLDISSAQGDVNATLENTAVTSITAAAEGIVTIDVSGDTIGGGDLVSITVTAADEAGVTLADDLGSFTTLDLSSVVAEVNVDVQAADFGGSVSYQIGATEVVNVTTDVANDTREVFNFVGDDIGTVEITGFDHSNAADATRDALDLSSFGITSAASLTFVVDGGDLVITANDGEFEGSITLVGLGAFGPEVAANNLLFA